MRGDVVEIFPVSEEGKAIRVEYWGDTIERIQEIDPLRGKALTELERYAIYPGSHYVTPQDKLRESLVSIRDELRERLMELESQGKLVERQRLEQRTMYDLEMLEQMGFCHGIENYSRHLSGRKAGEPPPTLIDYFPKDFLLILDESHQTIPQIGSMFLGDRARKSTLVEHGFRLPSAIDNRPLQFEEFETHVGQALCVSATPGDYELRQTHGAAVEQRHQHTRRCDLPGLATQHRQPPAMVRTGPSPAMSRPSMPMAPNSLTISAQRSPAGRPASSDRIAVVLPAPRKPVTMLTGMRDMATVVYVML